MEDSEYKLIKTVDPTKINVPIKPRFAKLTLSSNKKKNEIKDHQEPGNVQHMEKRQSASRNLLELLNEQQNNAPTSSGNSSNTNGHVNPILRSNSTSISPECDETQLNSSDEEYVDAQMEHQVLEESDFMEPLQISETQQQSQGNGSDMEQQLNALSQQVSTLTVSNRSPFSNRKQKVLKSRETSIIITETVNISTTDESELEIESAIIISDSSLSCTVEDDAIEYELITSNIPQSGETADALLPCTFSNDKADRMEAFLRDVSQDYRNRAENEEMETDSANENQKDNLDDAKAKQLATADTASMTSFISEAFAKNKQTETAPSKEQNTMLDDTIPMSQSHGSLFQIKSQEVLVKSSPDFILKPEGDNAERLQLDDTEPNTVIDTSLIAEEEDERNPTDASNFSFVPDTSCLGNVVPNDSLVISETSSEAEKSITTSCDNEIVPSEELVYSNGDAGDNDEDSSSSEIKMNMGSINISAKINIKIQISTQMSSDDDDGEDISSSSGAEANDNLQKNTPSLPDTVSNTENTEIATQYEEQRQQTTNMQLALEPKLDSETDTEIIDANFMTHAEKLLTQLYGKSWQTPDVIRTLKRTSGSGGKTSSTKKQTATKNSSATKKPPSRKCNQTTDKTKLPSNEKTVEESVLDDFSIFRRNIVRTNLNSTCLATPPEKLETKMQQQQQFQQNACSETKVTKKTIKKDYGVFKVPQTEVKKRVITTKRGRVIEQKWRQSIDSDSDSAGDNASDDEDADKTEQVFASNDDDQKSDHSWSNASKSYSGSDYDVGDGNKARRKLTTRRKKVNTTTVNNRTKGHDGSQDGIVYLDLSREEVTFLEGAPTTPPANNDENFNVRLQDILRTCRYENKPKLESTTATLQTKTKRKLFNINFGDEEDEELSETRTLTPKATNNAANVDDHNDILHDLENLNVNGHINGKLDVINKHLEAIKTGKPIFKVTPPRSTKDTTPTTKVATTSSKTNPSEGDDVFKTPKSRRKNAADSRLIENICVTPNYKYGFLQSLEVTIAKSFCHPNALCYRENYRNKKEELSTLLFDLYNEKVFNNDLEVPLKWNKKLSNTAGRCLNKKKYGKRTSEIELSEKVLTSGDRLRCTLIHELCHAATWIFNGEGGHGNTWREWARKANSVFPELPKIGVCHQYEIEYKYTYKCTLCAAKSHAHSKSKKVENIRCSYCHGAIEVFLNKKDKDGNIMPTPVREPTGFAKFVKDNYKQYKRADRKHADVMKVLSNEFAALKVAANANE